MDVTEQVVDGLDEVATSGCHREVDWVEVGLAMEAADEILLRVEIGPALAATWTDEGELAAT